MVHVYMSACVCVSVCTTALQKSTYGLICSLRRFGTLSSISTFIYERAAMFLVCICASVVKITKTLHPIACGLVYVSLYKDARVVSKV